MKNITKTILFFMLLLIALFLNPNFSKAATNDAHDEESLRSAIEASTDGENVINLTDNIILTHPVEIQSKKITINGNNHTISRVDTNWHDDGANGTLITAGIEANITLKDITLKDSKKYGAQAYDGGHLTLDNVTVLNCGYGGIIVNAGTVEIKKLHLGKNGSPNNNGIEIAKGNGIYTEDHQPTLVMNGTLTSTETENVIYLAINDQLSGFEVKNEPTTVDKIYVSNNKVIVADENGDALFESNTRNDISISGDNFTGNYIVTINLIDKAINITKQTGSKLSAQEITEKINLSELGLDNYNITGFYSDADYETEFNFDTPITSNITIYAKLETKPVIDNNTPTTEPTQETTQPAPVVEETPEVKDETPKTGIENYLNISLTLIIISIISIITLKRKEI